VTRPLKICNREQKIHWSENEHRTSKGVCSVEAYFSSCGFATKSIFMIEFEGYCTLFVCPQKKRLNVLFARILSCPITSFSPGTFPLMQSFLCHCTRNNIGHSKLQPPFWPLTCIGHMGGVGFPPLCYSPPLLRFLSLLVACTELIKLTLFADIVFVFRFDSFI
jgi:hypothetical protein